MQLYSVAAVSGPAMSSSQWSCGGGRRVSSPVVTDGMSQEATGATRAGQLQLRVRCGCRAVGGRRGTQTWAGGRPAGWIRAAAAAGPLVQGCAPYLGTLSQFPPAALAGLLAACYLLLAPHARVLRWAAWSKRAVDRWEVTTPTRTTAMGISGVSGYCESWLGKRGPGSCPGRQPEQWAEELVCAGELAGLAGLAGPGEDAGVG